MPAIQITEDVPITAQVHELGEAMRQVKELGGLIASIELENVQKGKSKLFMHVLDAGNYALSPIHCNVKGYTLAVPSPEDSGFRLAEERDEQEDCVKIIRRELFLNTKVKLYFNTPEHIMHLMERGYIK